MGNINAKDVLIIGNEVGNVGADGVGNFSSASGGNSSKIQLVGTKVKVNADNIKTDDLLVSAKDQAIVTQSTTGVYKNDKAIIDTALRTTANQNGDYKANFTTIDKSNANKFTALTTISTLEDWAYFAKGINENQEAMQSVDTFDLISDIDFGANCNSEGACTGQNYANFNVAGNSELQNVNMIIGKDYDHAFHANFNGNGYTLSNINIDATQLSQEFQENLNYIGLFGYVKNSGKEMKNLIIDYKYGGIKTNRKDYDYIGGFIGIANGGNFNKIRLSNLGSVSSYNGGIGGLISSTWSANFSNISLSNIKNLSGREVGGFMTSSTDSNFSNISIDGIENMEASVGNGGGFSAGAYIDQIEQGIFENIIIKGIKKITANAGASGFMPQSSYNLGAEKIIYSNIYIFFDSNADLDGYPNNGGLFFTSSPKFKELHNIHVYHNSVGTSDSDYWYKASSFTDGIDGKINSHNYGYNDLDTAYQAFLDKSNTITIDSPQISNINQDFIVNTTNNKISQNDISKEVIDSILADTSVDSWINVNDNPTKIQVSQGDINSINQSFDFMEALVDSNFIDFLVKENSQQYTPIASNITNILQAKTNIQALIGNVNNLVNNYNDFQNTKEDLNKAIDAYNAYVALINQGAASSKDVEFTSLKNKVNELYAKAQGYLDAYKFDDTLKSYKTQALSQSNNHFSIKGEFDTKLASLDSVLDKPNNEGGDTSNPEANAPLPFSEALLTQMDESVLKQDEDDKEPTVDEASTQLSGNTCIVSDNFKAGNPCSR
ncbi:hypothetical protein ACOTBA_000372 [Campylobacter jejuni]